MGKKKYQGAPYRSLAALTQLLLTYPWVRNIGPQGTPGARRIRERRTISGVLEAAAAPMGLKIEDKDGF